MFPSNSNAPIAWRAICLAASCHTAKHEDSFPEDARARARALLTAALEANRKAVAHIEAALSILD